MLKFGTKFLLSACLVVAVVILLGLSWRRFAAPPAVRRAERFLQTERLDAAAATIEYFLRDNPGDVAALRVRFYLELKTEKFPAALLTYRHLPESNSALMKALTYRDALVRGGAARLICESALPIETAKLIEALGDPDPAVRRYCAETLGQRRDVSALKPLFQILGDDNWYVRATAAEALGKLGDPRAAGWLLQVLNESDNLVRWNATIALRQVAAESNRVLLQKALATARPAKQLAIAVALAKLEDPLALDPLNQAVTATETATRRLVAEALGDFPAALTESQLLKLGADPDDGVREAALRSLQKVKSGGR